MNFTLNEQTADLLAKAIVRNMRKELMKMAKDIATSQSEQFLTIEETAAFLSMSKSTLYKKKDDIGCYTKVGRKIMFSKSMLIKAINDGLLRNIR